LQRYNADGRIKVEFTGFGEFIGLKVVVDVF
jgi:hypothetical protein